MSAEPGDPRRASCLCLTQHCLSAWPEPITVEIHQPGSARLLELSIAVCIP
jgi:hypothetical protein